MRHTPTIKNLVRPIAAVTVFPLLIFLVSCQIYQSPDRRDFENDRPQFQIQNYRPQSCGPESVRQFSEQNQIVYKDESIQVTEFKVGSQIVFEAETQQGDFCVLVQ